MDLQPYYMPVAIAGHLLAAVVWVGGMFFAYMALRPAAAKVLETSQQLQLWRKTLIHFFVWVWLCIIALPATGYWIIFVHYGGMTRAGLHVHIMQVLGIIMILIFLHIFFAPFARLRKAIKHEDFEAASECFKQMRKLIRINLSLGIIVVVVTGALRHLSFG